MTTLDELLMTLEDLSDHRRFNKLLFYEPYPKQAEFHALGLTKRERLLRAGNQEGKTYCAASETAMHLTGIYPTWWKGRRFEKPTRGWAAGESSVVVRDTQQKLLCGSPGVDADLGTGFIPKENIVDRSLSRGITDALDTVQVAHMTGEPSRKGRIKVASDGVSTLTFKSYEQGRTKFQADTIDFGWLDEEPEQPIYSETLSRITATGGMLFTTFTPLKGKTTLLVRFMDETSEDRAEVVMTIYDALHIAPEDRAKIIEGWPEHERIARAHGQPMMGEGRVFPFPDDTILEEDIPAKHIPAHWTRLWSIDFGSGGDAHPFAATLLLWDRDTDVLHVWAAIKTKEPLILQHASMMRGIAANVRVAWPHDGNTREKGSTNETKTTSRLYREAGLRMMDKHATFETGGFSTEAGVTEMTERIKTGRLKVSRSLIESDWGSEFRSYHRKDGLIVKLGDDLMSATRIGVMAKRYGDTTPLGPAYGGRGRGIGKPIADNVDFPLF